MEIIKIETPERIRFKYAIASTGSRASAMVIDLLIQAGILIIWGLLSYLILGGAFFNDFFFGEANHLITAFTMLLLFFLQWGYFSFFEILMGGQTPGKRALGLTVVSSTGAPLENSSILLRNLLRVVDAFPFVFYGVGGLISVLDKRSRRLGDILSGTLVVARDKKESHKPDFSFPSSEVIPHKSVEKLQRNLQASRNFLNENQIQIIRGFFQKKENMEEKHRTETAGKLAEMVYQSLGVDMADFTDEQYLSYIYQGHEIYEDI